MSDETDPAFERQVEAGARAMEPSAFETFDSGYTARNFIEERAFLNAERVVRRARSKCRAALKAADAVGRESVAGWKLVPVEPTEAMIDAWIDPRPANFANCARADWAAMLAAAPTPPTEGGGE